MTQQPLLTVGIPTYNRIGAVTRRVEEFLDLAMGPDVRLLVVDNDSGDGTFTHLRERFTADDVEILKNETNLGYAGNLLRVIEEARSDFVLVLSDEDELDPAGLDALIDFLRQRRPVLVSPRAEVGPHRVYRGRESTREIAPDEFESASFYISGLTFATEEARSSIPAVRSLMPTNSAATVYPQVLLTALMVARGNSYFLDASVSKQVEELDSHITEPSGASYSTLGARWSQFRGYEEFFAQDHAPLVGERGAARLASMRDHRRAAMHPMLFNAAVAEVPGIEQHFWRASVRYAVSGMIARLRGRTS